MDYLLFKTLFIEKSFLHDFSPVNSLDF